MEVIKVRKPSYKKTNNYNNITIENRKIDSIWREKNKKMKMAWNTTGSEKEVAVFPRIGYNKNHEDYNRSSGI